MMRLMITSKSSRAFDRKALSASRRLSLDSSSRWRREGPLASPPSACCCCCSRSRICGNLERPSDSASMMSPTYVHPVSGVRDL